jgi:hypothetical protein
MAQYPTRNGAGHTIEKIKMSNEQDIQRLEVSIKQAKEQVRLNNLYQKLKKRPEFKELIEEFYLKDYIINLVMLRGDANIPETSKEGMLKDLDAAGTFADWLRYIASAGRQAEAAILEDEQTITEIEDEGV